VSPDWPLETARLTLRPFVDGDFEAMHAMRSDAEVARYLYGEVLAEEETRDLLEKKMAGSSWTAEGDWLSAAVVERASGTTVGDLAFHWVSERDETAEVGFIFDPRHQGKGFATEAAGALIDWASRRPASTASSVERRLATPPRRACSRSSACGSRPTSSRTNG
jgi:RimJ/RimL family protein N-acetyltransferase